MDRYTKSFIVASLIYLAVASGLGLWMGAADAPEWALFIHVHFNLLGFMAMMVYGVGYFILPRFNARELYWPSWVPVHFFMANLGLVGMAMTAPERPSTGFFIFSLLSVFAAVMFTVNISATLLIPEKDEEKEATPFEITPDTKVGDILIAWPDSYKVFVDNGLAPLADPAHREQIKGLPITVAMASQRHGINTEVLVAALKKAVSGVVPVSGRTGGAQPEPVQIVGKGLVAGEAIKSHHNIGEIMKLYPQTRDVFQAFYGDACFSCPGQKTETVKQSAMMHNVDTQEVLAALNKAIDQ